MLNQNFINHGFNTLKRYVLYSEWITKNTEENVVNGIWLKTVDNCLF